MYSVRQKLQSRTGTRCGVGVLAMRPKPPGYVRDRLLLRAGEGRCGGKAVNPAVAPSGPPQLPGPRRWTRLKPAGRAGHRLDSTRKRRAAAGLA